ncbi:hypothetical protein HNQ94_003496 [Salirhabdus euzebyi]|uniref:YlbE-like protein n=1 Tax=Salirhabdus euzebyi TaxID=394506 RepID=A0A841Q9T8_9BACI|nr:YlbE-like family protein [Salirhabdus euzebyi]MBB6455002.1 hypothetical protein [Salirhabdus euzebyi]
MQAHVHKYLLQRPDLLHFVRMNPSWYRLLTRNPEQVATLEKASKIFYGKTFSQRVGRIQESMSLIQMLLSMSSAMNEPTE